LSDIFREVEEEVRRERFESIWKQYGDYIIAGFALIVIAIAGYELWQRYEANQAVKASETLIAAQQLADSGDFARATPAYAIIAKEAPSGYAEMARLSQANALAVAGKRDEAVTIYKSVATGDSGVIGSVALVRAGWTLVDSATRTDVQTLLAPLTEATNPWRHAAQEILAYADFHAAKYKQAQTEFQAIADDKDAPESMRRRTAAMAAFLKNGGMSNYGTVPAPPPPAATPAPAIAPPVAPPATGTPPQ
jgi:hypothetical protein